jgi:glutaredoxin 3
MTITIYSTTTCSACHSLTKWLDSLNVPYQKKITDENPDYMSEFMSVNDGMIGVPFTVITTDNGSVSKIVGYDQRKFKSVLGL